MKRLSFVAVLAGAFIAAFGGMQATAPTHPWPQATSDVPADPAVTFGTLPNGMRYLIRKNTTPAHQVVLRLRIETGSLDETESEEGIAHLIEHMAFRGSKRLADGALFKTLETLGAARGRDVNAETTPYSTVFMFDLPSNDDASLDKALMLMRDIAGNLTIAPKAVESERAVVLAELHQGDVPTHRGQQAYLSQVFGPRLAEALDPIGKAAVIERATAARLREFYRRHYRPERTVLLVVGDVDAKALEAKIKSRFADWTAGGKGAKRPDYAVKRAPRPGVVVFSQAGSASSVALRWITPPDLTADSIAKCLHARLTTVAMAVVNERLSALAQSADPPFVSAGAKHGQYRGIADYTTLSAQYAPGQALGALAALRSVYLTILRDGVRQAEIDRAVANMRRSFQTSIAAADTMPSTSWASWYRSMIAADNVVVSLAQSQVLFEQAVKNLRPGEITKILRSFFAGEPNVFISSPVPIAGADKSVAKILAQTSPSADATETAAKTIAWPYTSFGPPGKAAVTGKIGELGTTFALLDNGIRLTIKPTKLLAGQIMIYARFGDGRLGLPKDRKVPSWALGTAYISGGLNRLASADIPKSLAGREAPIHFNIRDTAFQLSGTTRPADYETELQLMVAYLTDAAWRPTGFEKIRASMLTSLDRMKVTAGSVFSWHFSTLNHDNDVRWAIPTPEEVRAARLEDVKALLTEAIARDPMQVIVVGDISVAEAVNGLEKTFGTLPKRPIQSAPMTGDERQPAHREHPIVLRYTGPPGQAVAMITWPTTGLFPDPKQHHVRAVLTRILSQRLFDTLRTEDGMTYGPGSGLASSAVSPGYGFISVWAAIPTARIAEFYTAVEHTVGDLKAKDVSGEELERVRGPMVHQDEELRQTNAYWLNALINASFDPREIDLIRTDLADLKAVTAADVRREAQAYLGGEKAWKVLVVPADYGLAEDAAVKK